MGLPRYKYNDLHPGHKVWKLAKYWGEEGQDLVSDEDIDDAIDGIINNCHPDPIEEMGVLEVFGFDDDPDCPECDFPEEGEPINVTCVVEVDPLDWTKVNRPDWLKAKK